MLTIFLLIYNNNKNSTHITCPTATGRRADSATLAKLCIGDPPSFLILISQMKLFRYPSRIVTIVWNVP